jgi:hypothetical protein
MMGTKTIRRLLIALVLAAGMLAPASLASAAESGLSGVVHANNPLRPVLTLQNNSAAACQVAATDIGTVAITEVRQDGKVIEPLSLGSSPGDSLELQLPKQLKTLQPGQSTEIPLSTYPFKQGHSLESVTWSSETGAFRTIYKIRDDKPLQITLTYDVPLAISKGAPLCGLAYASNAGSGRSLTRPITVSAVIVLAIALLVWVFKNRRRLKALLPILVLAGTIGVVWHAPKAQAAYIVPPEIQTRWDECMGYFQENRDITGPVLDALDAATTVEVVHVTWDGPGANDSSGSRELSYYRIYWNPDTVYQHYDGVNSEGCSALFHEMWHNYEISQGILDTSQCGDSGISTKEVNATRAENRLRDRLGLPLRTTYGARTLPEGDEPCTPPPPPPECTGDGCADSNGDPHLMTFDGVLYDFQAVGEFVAVTDKSGGYEMQVRQEPWPHSRVVSVNTATAMKVGKDRVELKMLGGKLRLWANGKEQALKDTKLPGGGSIIAANAQQAAVVWPDGSTAAVSAIGTFGLHIAFDPAPDKKGKLEGLFGNLDGDPKNDLVIRGTKTILQPEFKQLYPKFADSWRVDARSSLFAYDKGASTETYTDRSFPDEETATAGLPNHAAAEQICRSLGVTNKTVLNNCILDVALTGRPEFAAAAAASQARTTGTDYGGTVYPVSVKNPGESAEVTFEAKSGDKIFVDAYGTTLPDQCGVLSLVDPTGQEVTSGCIINGRGLIDGTTLEKTGTYKIVLKPSDGRTTNAKLRLLFITDKTAAIQPDGAAVTAVVDKPGVVANFTFSGIAGQRVFVDIPSTTLPGQCGGLDLVDPDGTVINTGCAIDGQGYIDTTILPKTGTYTIAINPVDRGTGRARVQLFLPAEHDVTLSVSGPSAKVKLSKPGDTAVIRFSANAGQKVYAEISGGTFTQCGGLGLQAPDGSEIGSGCVIDGSGTIDPDSALPASGVYTLTVDPVRDTTAEFTVRIRS